MRSKATQIARGPKASRVCQEKALEGLVTRLTLKNNQSCIRPPCRRWRSALKGKRRRGFDNRHARSSHLVLPLTLQRTCRPRRGAACRAERTVCTPEGVAAAQQRTPSPLEGALGKGEVDAAETLRRPRLGSLPLTSLTVFGVRRSSVDVAAFALKSRPVCSRQKKREGNFARQLAVAALQKVADAPMYTFGAALKNPPTRGSPKTWLCAKQRNKNARFFCPPRSNTAADTGEGRAALRLAPEGIPAVRREAQKIYSAQT